jgi:hypothetical protein
MLTDLDFIRVGETFPPTSESGRMNDYATNLAVFDGDHATVFADSIKRIVRIDDLYKPEAYEVLLNWPRLISKRFADMTFGEPPVVSVTGDEKASRALRDIIIRSGFFIRGHESVMDASRFGDGLMKARTRGGKAYVCSQTPKVWYPVFDIDDTTIRAHVLAWSWCDNDGRMDNRGRAEIHTEKSVTIRDFTLSGGIITSVTDASAASHKASRPLVFHMPTTTTTDSAFGISDYDDICSIVCEMEVRVAQESRIHDKHSDPNMYGPEGALSQDEESGEVSFTGGSYIPMEIGEQPPGYLVWNGALEAHHDHRDFLISQLYALAEVCPALFGKLEQGQAESGSALRRLLLAPLMKVNRIRLHLDPVVHEVLATALVLEGFKVSPSDISIDWQDGLPTDDTEITQNMVARKGVGLIDTKSAVAKLDGISGDALDEAVSAIGDADAAFVAPEPM